MSIQHTPNKLLPQRVEVSKKFKPGSSQKTINWTNTLFLILTPVGGVGALAWMILHECLSEATVWLAVGFLVATGLSVTAGYHRLFSHRSYCAAWPIRLLYLLFAAASFEGSALEWCTDHRRHHLYVDTPKDPYNINQGFWHAHIGWLIFLDPSRRNFKNVHDLQKDPFVSFQHRFFVLIAILMGFVLPALIAMSWGDFWGGLLIAGALRITINQHATFCVNSVCHTFGRKPYSSTQTARDHWVTALFTYGEGFHNFHHQFMFDYRNGIRFYHYDPAKWLIQILAFLGLAWDLKRASSKNIIRYIVRVHETQLRSQVAQNTSVVQYVEKLMEPVREAVLQAAAHLERLEEDYHAFKKEKIQALKGKMSEYRFTVRAKKEELKVARSNLTAALARWHQFQKEYSF